MKNFTGKETISLEEAIKFLNEILKEDPELINSIFNTYHKCNKKTRGHKTIQVCCSGDYSENNPACRLIGLLNGLFGIDEDGYGGMNVYYETLKGVKIEKFKLLDKEEKKRYNI